MLPLAYAVRNLMRTPSRCLQLILGSGLVVLLVCVAAAFQHGMDRSLAASAEARNVILLGAGSEESVERSEVPRVVPGIVAGSIRGLAEVMGRPAVSGEVYYNGLVHVPGVGASPEETERQAILRGVEPEALAVHRSLRLIDGTFPGPDEVMVGRRAHHLLNVPERHLAVGEILRFEERDYRISGRFAAPGSVLESEVWMGLEDLLAATQRTSLSCVILRLDQAEFGDVDLFANQRFDLELVAIREDEYYGKLREFFAPLKLMAWITAGLIAAGALFGGLNTWYAAFAARIGEMGTLQAIGFKRRVILLSLLQESILATLAGTFLALVIGLLVLDGLSVAFSTGVFALRFDATVLRTGLITGILLGAIGCLPPAWRCLAPPLPSALRSA